MRWKPKLSILEIVEVFFGSFLFWNGLYWLWNNVLGLLQKSGVSIPVFVKSYDMSVLYVMLLSIIFLVLYKLIDRKPFSSYGVRTFNLEDIRTAVCFLGLLFPISLAARLVDPSFDIWYAKLQGLTVLSGVIFFIITMPLFVIKEEVIQRGLIQSKMSRYGTLATILVVSANFSLMHYMLGAPKIHIWSAVISVFFGSIVVVLLFEKTRNLFLTILVHLVYNCAVAYQIYLHAVNNTAAEIVFWTVYGIVFLLTAKHSWKILKGYAWLGKDFSVLDWIILPAYGVIFPLLLVFWTQVKAFLF